MKVLTYSFMGLVAVGGLVGCDTSSPSAPAAQVAMRDEAKAALEKMEANDPSLANSISSAYGYVVFPDVGQGAIGIGGANGKGVVYQNGNRVGTVSLTQVSIGPALGGQTYGELIIFQNQDALNRLMNNSLEFGAEANATILRAGASGAAQFNNGVKVYILPKGGLEAGVSISGQKFHYSASSDNAPAQ